MTVLVALIDRFPLIRQPRAAVIVAALLFAAQLLALGLIFKHGIDFECRAHWPDRACSGASGALISVYCVAGMLFLYAMLRPRVLRALVADAGVSLWPLTLNALGFAIALLPVLWLPGGAAPMWWSFAAWIVGMVLLMVGLAFYMAPLPRWSDFVRTEWQAVVPVVVLGGLAPVAATVLRPLWRLEAIADATFSAVAWAISLLGYEVLIDAQAKNIGTTEFAINVAPVCSGIEGFALVTVFVTVYLGLFRHQLRFPRALLLYPLGIAASAVFNIVRITVLLAIGLEGNPELAVGGFHSHAGWMMFTLVALGIVVLAQSVPALRKDPDPTTRVQSPLLPFWQDPAVAAIVPFAVFMLTAIPVAAFSEAPGVVYPLRVVIVGAVMAAFWSIYRALPWRASPVAVITGAVIAAYWILIPVEPGDGSAAYGALTGAALLGWFVMRGIGTMVLVPILEELFFRQYLHRLVASVGTGRAWVYLASLVTAALFAALHDRWAEAFVAGLIFSWVAHRKGGTIVDAIVSHAVANALIFGVAVATGRLEMI